MNEQTNKLMTEWTNERKKWKNQSMFIFIVIPLKSIFTAQLLFYLVFTQEESLSFQTWNTVEVEYFWQLSPNSLQFHKSQLEDSSNHNFWKTYFFGGESFLGKLPELIVQPNSTVHSTRSDSYITSCWIVVMPWWCLSSFPDQDR